MTRSKCTLPDLNEMLARASVESTDRVCPEHRIHQVRDGKLWEGILEEPAKPMPAYPKTNVDPDVIPF